MAVSLGLAVLALYAATRASAWDLPTIFSMDGAELVIASRGLGIDHPPGHPLYLLLGYLFTRLPFGSPDAGVVAVSVAAGAAAIALVFLAALELTGRRLPAIVAALALGLAPIFWLHATIIEVYALQAAALALFVMLAVGAVRRRSARWLASAALAFGLLAATNPLLAVLVVPILVVAIAGSDVLRLAPLERRRAMVGAALGLVAGLLPFLYIPWRLAAAGSYVNDIVVVSGYPLQSLTWYAWYLSGWEFVGEKVAAYGVGDYRTLVWQYLVSLVRNLSPVGAALGALGAWTLVGAVAAFAGAAVRAVGEARASVRRADRAPGRLRLWAERLASPEGAGAAMSAAILLGLAATIVPVLGYQVPDREVFYLPSFLFAALAAAVGASRLACRGGWNVALAVAAAGLVAWSAWAAGPWVVPITRDTTRFAARLERFRQIPRDAVLIGYDDGLTAAYRYFGLVRGLRPDVTIETFARNAPRYQGPLDVRSSALSDIELRAGLNMADRVEAMNRLLARYATRPMFLILTERIPPEFPSVRLRRSAFDPQLFAIERKPGVERSAAPIAAVVPVEEDLFPGEIRLTGWGIRGLDGMGSASFKAPLPLGAASVNALVMRGELFEVSYVARRERPGGETYFASFALVDDRGDVIELEESGFAASRQVQVMDGETPSGGYRRDSFDFRLPAGFPAGPVTLAVRLYVATGESAGTYKGREVRRMRPVEPAKPLAGQSDYAAIGTVMVQ